MRLSMAVVLFALASCVSADDPPPPIEVGPRWEKTSYKALDYDSGKEEKWHFQQVEFRAALLITRQECAPCKLVTAEWAQHANTRPGESAIPAHAGKRFAVFGMSTEPSAHLITSFGVSSESYYYRLELTTLDSISARDSMKVQQQLMRMVEGWEPK